MPTYRVIFRKRNAWTFDVKSRHVEAETVFVDVEANDELDALNKACRRMLEAEWEFDVSDVQQLPIENAPD